MIKQSLLPGIWLLSSGNPVQSVFEACVQGGYSNHLPSTPKPETWVGDSILRRRSSSWRAASPERSPKSLGSAPAEQLVSPSTTVNPKTPGTCRQVVILIKPQKPL